MFQIEIPRRASACLERGESFISGMRYHSAIVLTEEQGVVERRDYCEKCWAQQQQKVQPHVLSSWKSVVPPEKRESGLPKQRDERALYLLKEVLKSDLSEQEGEAFVLALYLSRRRRLLLRHDINIEGGRVASLYEVADTEEMLCVPKVPLSDLQVEAVQCELAKKFLL